ncbi:MAG: phosphoenolpyruvate carboxylase, partial [Gemmatimonadota bacterium]
MLDIGILTADPAKIERDLDELIGCFREVLEEAGHPGLAAWLPWSSTSAEGTAPPAPQLLAQASSTAFELLTMVEQNATAAHRRQLETEEGLAAVRSLWGAVLAELRDGGATGEEIARAVEDTAVEIVLTAHPTEAKRATVLEHHRELDRLIRRRDRSDLSPTERAEVREGIKSWLMLLWRTGEIFLEKPDVASERRNVVHYLTNVFPGVVPVLDRRLRQAWRDAGLDTSRLADPGRLPRVRIGTWVGGDRDGHPLVTADVTRESLLDLRLNALVRLDAELVALSRRLSLSDLLQAPPPALREKVAAVAADLGPAGEAAVARNPDETWRQAVNLMRARLPVVVDRGPKAVLAADPGAYRRAAELRHDLDDLHQALREVGAHRIARDAVEPVLRNVDAFGFHLARLDVRQNSAFHDRALAQLFSAAGIDAA